MNDFDRDDFEFDASVFDMDDLDAEDTADYYDTGDTGDYYGRRKRGGWAKKILATLLTLALLTAGVILVFMLFFARPPGEGDIVTLLVAGQDNVGEHGLSDTIMLVSLDTANSSVHIVSIPRDTKVDESWAVPKINSVYAMTGGSAPRLLGAVEAITGFAVDGYIILDMQAFTDLVDAVDGVYFEVPRYMRYDDPYQNLHIHLQPGYQHLNGEQALHFIRWRQNNDGTGFANGDLGRIASQQSLMQALAAELLAIRNPLRMVNIARVFAAHVETDLHLGNLLWLARQAMGMNNEAVTFLMIPNYPANIGGIWYQVIQLEEWLLLINTQLNPAPLDVREENLRVFAFKDGWVQRLGEGRTLTPGR